MLRSIAFGCAAVLIGSSAHAADLEPPAPYDWSGPYVGLHAGYLWGDVDIDEEETVTGTIDGFIGGALAGFAVQYDPFVLGIEGDIGWTDADGEGGQQIEYDYSYDLNWNAHIRGLLGFAFDRGLIFLAGGFAYADFDVDQNVETLGGSYYGWTIGGGINYAFTDNLIGRVEYLHDEFGEEDYEEEDEDYTADLDTDTVRAALIYKFTP
jgi:outer membrane immunogenic protein